MSCFNNALFQLRPRGMNLSPFSNDNGRDINSLREKIRQLKSRAVRDYSNHRHISARKVLLEAEKLAKPHRELDLLRARVLHELAFTEEMQGNWANAEKLYQKCLKLENEIDDNLGKGTTIHQLAHLKSQQQRPWEAIALYQQALDAQCLADDLPGQAATLHQLAQLSNEQGDASSAIEYYRRLRSIDAASGDQQAQADALYHLGYLLSQRGDHEEALAAYQESVQLDSLSADRAEGMAMTLAHMGRLHQSQGNLEQAMALYQQALEALQKIDSVLAQSKKVAIMHSLGNTAAALGNIDDALALYQDALQLDDEPHGRAAILTAAGQLLAEQEQPDFARSLDYVREALQLLEQVNSDDSDYVRNLIESIQQAAV